MSPRRSVFVVADSIANLLPKPEEVDKRIDESILFPDPDVVLYDLHGMKGESPLDSRGCFHGEQVEGVGLVKCDRRAVKAERPHGFLCSDHDAALLRPPKPTIRFFGGYNPHAQIDLKSALPLIQKEVRDARANLADSEIHDYKEFERLQEIQVEKDIMERFMLKD